jgi:phage terminase small subunit
VAPLPNTRQERFVQGLFEGKSATQAYADAGYRPHQGNSSRLRWFEMVQTRLAELQSEAAQNSQVTVASILKELEHARQRADDLDQLSASVKAISEKAKIAGLSVEKVQIQQAEFDDDMSVQEILDKVTAEAGIEAAVALCRAFKMDPRTFGLTEINGNYAGEDGKDREMRPACLDAKSFKPSVTQRLLEEPKPVNRKRQIG